MKPLDIPLQIEPMAVADIPEVMALERLSYAMTWPQKAYDYELTQNKLAHYYVLRVADQQSTGPAAIAGDNVRSDLLAAAGGRAPIIGLAGFWLMVDQIHISTIAVHPDWRRLGLGEWLLVTLLETGQSLGAETATLEVRPSNLAAIALYRKYDFRKAGCRRRYYTDNNEDALILTTPPLALPDYQTMFQQRKAALAQRLAQMKEA
ncbi:MAG: ribosomal protein S18-alanine N-acetyltransferase [Chloroflexota bacterium]